MSASSDRRWRAHHFFYHGDLDLALRRFVPAALGELVGRCLIDRFFFIRYTVGGPHLRLRYRLRGPESSAAAASVLERAAARFLERWRSSGALDPEQIRRESRAILAAMPEQSELYYDDNSLLEFPFDPEVDRYGGRRFLEPSLEFFVVSSAQAIETIGDGRWTSAGRRGALAFRLLLRQAWGFAAGERELLSHLGYRLPVEPEIADAIWSKADQDFETHRDAYRALFRHELRRFAEADGGGSGPPDKLGGLLLYEASRTLSQAVREADPRARWQIGHSQLHMAANRLGFTPFQEMHLQRLLQRTAEDVRESDSAAWRRAGEVAWTRNGPPRPPLALLCDAALGSIRAAASTSESSES